MSTTAISMTVNGYYARADLGVRPVRVIDHDADHGFCSVCGAVWPCSRARRAQQRAGSAVAVW